ncbi:hypothetical protein Bca4012_099568 [Brassica carinata]
MFLFLLQQDENAIEKKAPPSPLPRFRVHFFCKTLTLQTQVHMISGQSPYQELVAKVELANRELYFLELREDSLLDLQRVKSQSVSEESLKNAPVPTIVYENFVHCVLFIVDVE